ncbi:MAG: hypothetical protein EXR99_14585 [Gemmataceae bacterium]|nr:hypothetical protein [Gemmataceae bacterium]
MQSPVENVVKVEFFGIPRKRVGLAACLTQPGSLREILQELQTRFPSLDCANKAHPEFLISLDGACFISLDSTPVLAGQTLVLLSADAGG